MNNEEIVTMAFKAPELLRRRLKVRAAQENRTMRELIVELLERGLEEDEAMKEQA